MWVGRIGDHRESIRRGCTPPAVAGGMFCTHALEDSAQLSLSFPSRLVSPRLVDEELTILPLFERVVGKFIYRGRAQLVVQSDHERH